MSRRVLSFAVAMSLPLVASVQATLITGTRIVFSTETENLATVSIGNVGDVLVRTRNPSTGAVTFENVNRNAAGAVGTL